MHTTDSSTLGTEQIGPVAAQLNTPLAGGCPHTASAIQSKSCLLQPNFPTHVLVDVSTPYWPLHSNAGIAMAEWHSKNGLCRVMVKCKLLTVAFERFLAVSAI
jgi:hypothetical protein